MRLTKVAVSTTQFGEGERQPLETVMGDSGSWLPRVYFFDDISIKGCNQLPIVATELWSCHLFFLAVKIMNFASFNSFFSTSKTKRSKNSDNNFAYNSGDLGAPFNGPSIPTPLFSPLSKRLRKWRENELESKLVDVYLPYSTPSTALFLLFYQRINFMLEMRRELVTRCHFSENEFYLVSFGSLICKLFLRHVSRVS